MRILEFLGALGLGGMEKATLLWTRELQKRGHSVAVISLRDGPRRQHFESSGAAVFVVPPDQKLLEHEISQLAPDAIHVHAPGYPYEGNVLAHALRRLRKKIPVVQTNIFGRLEDPLDDEWIGFRLFISWTSCVQAARRSGRPLSTEFFRRQSVAVYPVPDPYLEAEIGRSPLVNSSLPTRPPYFQTWREEFRRLVGAKDDEVLFGRFSRPEPNKWTDLPVKGFLKALQANDKIKLLLREPPPAVAEQIRKSPQSRHFIILPATSDPRELLCSQLAIDAVLHGSSIGESFGYGIAEPMALEKPVIANSTPWADQCQIELLQHGRCGFVASVESTVADAILRLAGDADLRKKMGVQARAHVLNVANISRSVDSVEHALNASVRGGDNESAVLDCETATRTSCYLDSHQFGCTFAEAWALHSFNWRVRLSRWRRSCKGGRCFGVTF